MSQSSIPFHTTVTNTANPRPALTHQSVASVLMAIACDAAYWRLSREFLIALRSMDIITFSANTRAPFYINKRINAAVGPDI
jgi:hypothetical protein